MKEYTRIDSLGKKHKIVVSDAHTFGTDAVLLSTFANIRKKDKAVDLGTGCGIIPLLWCKGETNEIYAVEIQERGCNQLKESLEINNFQGRINVVNSDLRKLEGKLPTGYFDLVTMNPPYKPVGTGIESVTDADKIARHETMCNIDDVTTCAGKLLKYGGRLCVCHRPERLCDIIVSMREHKIEAKRIRFVCKNEKSEPWLVLVEGRYGEKSGVRIEPNLIMYTSDGEYTDEVKLLFKDYYIEN